MYVLFVLGELLDSSLSGYRLHEILAYKLGPRFKVSWGIIYPLLDKLVAAGDITLTETAEPGQRSKKIASITAQGRQTFHNLMLAPIKAGKNEDIQYTFKLSNLHHLAADERQMILNSFIAYQELDLASARRGITGIADNDSMVPADRFMATKLQEYRIKQTTTAIEWAQAMKITTASPEFINLLQTEREN
ncbi:hypothetical protein WOSG25_150210 [Weissella oryzae SG25]|uniref:Transcription regulator PadR N-terminal domain-containing protein n=1 Tax=Weissella oryzae (strain DSM 25784 / JCM 18191 / LMG 30913 / SG25) TaxID=1329250 RepID=A0A069CVJ0_WEIOS|nr:PadR family transcriptional regulator [Weissella oryzae]GAK31770.1 hypothetical protein WOSG25_150210 [Weissella oryzae SG25]